MPDSQRRIRMCAEKPVSRQVEQASHGVSAADGHGSPSAAQSRDRRSARCMAWVARLGSWYLVTIGTCVAST